MGIVEIATALSLVAIIATLIDMFDPKRPA